MFTPLVITRFLGYNITAVPAAALNLHTGYFTRSTSGFISEIDGALINNSLAQGSLTLGICLIFFPFLSIIIILTQGKNTWNLGVVNLINSFIFGFYIIYICIFYFINQEAAIFTETFYISFVSAVSLLIFTVIHTIFKK